MAGRVARGLRKPRIAMATHGTRRTRRRAGFSLVEIMVAVGILGVMIALASPSFQQFFANQRLRSAATSVADALLLARAEAIRTGNRHIVFLSAAPAGNPPATDPAGTALGVDPSTGGSWPVLIVNDGPTAGSNCQIDLGEPQRPVAAQPGVAWGTTVPGPTQNAPNDGGLGDPASGSSFSDQNGNARTWVMFRADGVPVGFTNGCAIGQVGSGNGAVYLSNGVRNYAVVLTALGGVRVHAWEAGANAWTE